MTLRIVAVVAILGCVRESAEAAEYTYTEIVAPPPLPQPHLGEAYGINSQGQAVGYFSDTYSNRPFLYDGEFKYLGDARGVAFDINDSGRVVGVDGKLGENFEHAFLYDGTMQDLGTLGGRESAAYGINNNGLVTGAAELPEVGSYRYHAFLYDGEMHDIGTLGGDYSVGTDVNASGHVTGYSMPIGNTTNHAFVYDGVTMKDLGTLGGLESQGTAINDLGHVVGISQVSDDPFWHVFYYDGTSMHDLGRTNLNLSTGAPYSVPIGDINNHDQIVAEQSIWSPTTGWQNLDSLTDFGPIDLYWARGAAINDAGEIAGSVRLVGIPQPALLTPIPEPSMFPITALCIIAWRYLAATG